MKLPRFSTEAKFYRTIVHDQTTRYPIQSFAQAKSEIRPALMKSEVINVYDCSPGFVRIGNDENYQCIPDPSWGDGGEGPDRQGSGGPSEGRGGGGGGGTPPSPKTPKDSKTPEDCKNNYSGSSSGAKAQLETCNCCVDQGGTYGIRSRFGIYDSEQCIGITGSRVIYSVCAAKAAGRLLKGLVTD